MLLDTLSAAHEVGVSHSTFRRWLKEGRVSFVRLGRRVLVRREALDEFVKAYEQPARSERISERGAGSQGGGDRG